jgi:hypothetical protein
MPTPAPRALALRTTGVTYPGAADQVRVVRADLRALLDDCPMADDVLVCASELVTNADAPRGALLYPRRSREELKGGSWA